MAGQVSRVELTSFKLGHLAKRTAWWKMAICLPTKRDCSFFYFVCIWTNENYCPKQYIPYKNKVWDLFYFLNFFNYISYKFPNIMNPNFLIKANVRSWRQTTKEFELIWIWIPQTTVRSTCLKFHNYRTEFWLLKCTSS